MPDSDVVERWLLLLLAAAAVLIIYLKHRAGSPKLKLPPGPRGIPVFGNLSIFVFSSHPHHKLDSLSKQYGPIMSIRLGSLQGIVVSSPDVAKEVLKTFDKEFAARPKMTVKDALAYGDYSLGLSHGPRWRFARKVATLELLSQKRVQQFEAVRSHELSLMVRTMWEQIQASPDSVMNMSQRATYLVLNMMTRTLMNKRFLTYGTRHSKIGAPIGIHAAEFKEMMDQTFFLHGVSIIGDAIPYLGFLDRIMNYQEAMRRVHKQYDSFMNMVLDEHRRPQSESHGKVNTERDFVDILLSLPGEDGAEKMEESAIKGLFVDMINAGTDTSSISLEWGLSELLRNPAVLHKLQNEVDSVVGKDRLFVESDVPNLPYLQAVVKEIFRLHPAGPLLLPHLSTQACQIAGYHIPAGTTTIVNVWSICRNPQVWDKPLEFLPERFLNKDTDVRGQHFELLTFGTGRRGCPGMHLGLAVVHYVLGRLVHSFDWSLPEGQAPQDLDMADKFGLTLPRATPLMALPTPRLAPHLY